MGLLRGCGIQHGEVRVSAPAAAGRGRSSVGHSRAGCKVMGNSNLGQVFVLWPHRAAGQDLSGSFSGVCERSDHNFCLKSTDLGSLELFSGWKHSPKLKA